MSCWRHLWLTERTIYADRRPDWYRTYCLCCGAVLGGEDDEERAVTVDAGGTLRDGAAASRWSRRVPSTEP